MQFQVPQNIAMEDRIIGPFTTMQFGIMVVGGGIAFFLGTSVGLPSPINNIVGFGLALFTFIMAVGKFNNQPLFRFIKFIIAFIIRPHVRVWHKKGMETRLIKPTQNASQQQAVRLVKKVSKQDIIHLAAVLDSRGSKGLAPHIQTEMRPRHDQPAKPKTP